MCQSLMGVKNNNKFFKNCGPVLLTKTSLHYNICEKVPQNRVLNSM